MRCLIMDALICSTRIPADACVQLIDAVVQTLLAQGIDTHNIVVNGILYRESGSNCSLCAARMNMQSVYLDQFSDLYADFNLVRVPLLPSEVRGPEKLKEFSKMLVTPYTPPA